MPDLESLSQRGAVPALAFVIPCAVGESGFTQQEDAHRALGFTSLAAELRVQAVGVERSQRLAPGRLQQRMAIEILDEAAGDAATANCSTNSRHVGRRRDRRSFGDGRVR